MSLIKVHPKDEKRILRKSSQIVYYLKMFLVLTLLIYVYRTFKGSNDHSFIFETLVILGFILSLWIYDFFVLVVYNRIVMFDEKKIKKQKKISKKVLDNLVFSGYYYKAYVFVKSENRYVRLRKQVYDADEVEAIKITCYYFFMKQLYLYML